MTRCIPPWLFAVAVCGEAALGFFLGWLKWGAHD